MKKTIQILGGEWDKPQLPKKTNIKFILRQGSHLEIIGQNKRKVVFFFVFLSFFITFAGNKLQEGL